MKAYSALASILLSAAAVCGQEAQGEFVRSLNISGAAELDLNTDSGGISVSAGPAGVVKVRAILKAQRGWPFNSNVEDRIRRIESNPPVEQSGNRIRIGHVSDTSLMKGISMRLEIQAPAESRVRAQADSGGIRVEGIKGPVDCRTDSGGIRIRDVQDSVFARADSGGIEAIGVAGPVDIETDSGGIRVEQTKAAIIRARADSGGAQLRLARSEGYDLSLSSESGRVSAPTLDSGSNVSRHKASGKLRGGGPTVSVEVDSGGIVVD